MWIIVATVLLLYLLGFLFICFLNAENHGNPSSSNNNSLSASNNNDETENFCQRHHLGGYHRLFLSRLLSSNFRYDEEEAGNRQVQQRSDTANTSSSRQGQSTLDPSRSALFAYRQQQLRQIHHEINEMSYLLGASQSQSDQQTRSVPVPILSRANLVQPLRNFGSSSNYFTACGRTSRSRYSFVHELVSPLPPSLEGADSATTGDTALMSSRRTCTTANNIIIPNNTTNMSTSGASSITYHSCSSNSLSYSPSGSESCHIFQERQRRLRHIRMELEGLSLQLNNADDMSVGGTTAAANASSSSLLMMSASPTSAGTTFGMGESTTNSSLIYFDRRNANIINGSSWSDDNDDDDLPGYESIVCLLDSSQRVDGSTACVGGEKAEESPPPSYNDVVHLYSFGEQQEKEK